jgi:hypothetical protein
MLSKLIGVETMFDKKIEIPWHRTNINEDFSKWDWPKPGQICLIFFRYTGFSISEYSESEGDHVFFDCDGFLGDDDLLWISLNELPAVGSFKHIVIPDYYLKDPKFKLKDEDDEPI